MNNQLLIRLIRGFLIIVITGAMIHGAINQYQERAILPDYFKAAFTAALSLGLTYIPNFLKHKDIMMVPLALHTVFTVFVLLAMYFGEILHFYDRFFWWDSMLHFASGILFASIGYLLFVSFNRSDDLRNQLNPAFVLLFCFTFSVACGALWEVFEFSADVVFSSNMQRWQTEMDVSQWNALRNVSNRSNPGLIDTMKDIINDSVGTLLALPMILPLVKRDNRYTKTQISVAELFEKV